MDQSTERSIDQLTNLPVDLLLQQLTYLPFEDVISVCTSNATLHFYCSDPKYNNKWRQLIDTTFNTVYNYEDTLEKIWSKLHLVDGTYNYLVYTKLIGLLDPLTQLMIYYRQNDTKSFEDKNRFTDDQRFLTMFLLNNPSEMKKYRTTFNDKPYYILLEGNIPPVDDLNSIMYEMAENGNVRGVKYLEEKGSNIHATSELALRLASKKGHIDLVKYLIEKGADIHAQNDQPLKIASEKGYFDLVRYLVEKGANIRSENNYALKAAVKKGYLDVVKYLTEQGANINSSEALLLAVENMHLDVLRYLVENGADIHVYNDLALRIASAKGNLDQVKYLVEKGANIHANNDAALKAAQRENHINIVKYLSEN